MNSNRSKPLFCLIPSLLALVLTAVEASATEIPLRAFTASYNLYQGGMHVAHTELSLRREGDSWHWRMTTKPRSVYAWFIRKRPVNETRFARTTDGFRLLEISITDEKRPQQQEAASFDWANARLSVMRKGKRREIPLDRDVYDYQSIHLLAAQMTRDGLRGRSFDFYRKGNLVGAQINSAGTGHVLVQGKRLEANIYEQVTTRSRAKVKYYYDVDNPMLPLRIERLESGETSSLMTLREVNWKL